MDETKKDTWVYIAAPLSTGDVGHNVRVATLVGMELRDRAGVVPIIPHTSLLTDLISPHDYEYWMALDFALIRRCDVLCRLPGKSPGAGREEELARRLCIPVITAASMLLGPESARVTDHVTQFQRSIDQWRRGRACGNCRHNPQAAGDGWAQSSPRTCTGRMSKVLCAPSDICLNWGAI